jgi:hypothetical protein
VGFFSAEGVVSWLCADEGSLISCSEISLFLKIINGSKL